LLSDGRELSQCCQISTVLGLSGIISLRKVRIVSYSVAVGLNGRIFQFIFYQRFTKDCRLNKLRIFYREGRRARKVFYFHFLCALHVLCG
jgi:hypothetical protein